MNGGPRDKFKPQFATITEFYEYESPGSINKRAGLSPRNESSVVFDTPRDSSPVSLYRFKEPSLIGQSSREAPRPQRQVNDLLCTPSVFRGKQLLGPLSTNLMNQSPSEFGDMTHRPPGSVVSRSSFKKPTNQIGSTQAQSRSISKFFLEPQSVNQRSTIRRPRVFAERLQGLKGLGDAKKLQEAEINIVKDLVLKGGGDLKSKFKMLDRVGFP